MHLFEGCTLVFKSPVQDDETNVGAHAHVYCAYLIYLFPEIRKVTLE